MKPKPASAYHMNHSLEESFISLVDQHRKIIYKICYLYTNSAADLADYYQESLINLWRAYPNFQNRAQVSTWVYRITLNTCITFLRRKESKPPTMPLTIEVEQLQNQEEDAQIKQLYNLINRLNPLEKAIIMLYLDNKNYQEMAAIVGTTTNNIGVKLNRIREKLKNMSHQ